MFAIDFMLVIWPTFIVCYLYRLMSMNPPIDIEANAIRMDILWGSLGNLRPIWANSTKTADSRAENVEWGKTLLCCFLAMQLIMDKVVAEIANVVRTPNHVSLWKEFK